MDGILFYWIGWMYIITVSFLLDGKYPRMYLVTIGFVTIILSTITYGNHLFEWNFAYLPFLFICLGRIKYLTAVQIIYGYGLSAIITIWFLTIHRLTFLEPVWLFTEPEWI
ncbi:YphA family membrane protein, partial [Salipaludibacillus sp. CF4.18]|uniref:YphA family membrane protein n=1 Tax=Salipaludibacillus sp. CF4.18 TaxID=3373081 RepID=UPI003EE44632